MRACECVCIKCLGECFRCMSVYMYVCVCTYVCTCVYVCMYECVRMYVCCTYVGMQVRLFVYMYVCMYVYTCICAYAHMHVCIRTHACTHACMYIHTCMHTCVYVCAHMHACIRPGRRGRHAALKLSHTQIKESHHTPREGRKLATVSHTHASKSHV